MRRRVVGLLGTLVLGAWVAAGCGSGASSPTSSAPAKTSAPASSSASPAASGGGGSAASPLQGKTISLVVAGGAGGTFDLEARALAPFVGKILHATVHVVDMSGGGGLKGWDYVATAPPDGTTLGVGNVQGMIANVWEKVPGQNFTVTKLTWLGGFAGGHGLLTKVIFTNQTKPPFDSLAHLIAYKGHLTELGATGDVSGPLFFTIYHLNYRDLTSYADANAQKAGMLRGDGQFDVKPYAGWKSLVTSGHLHMLVALTMASTWVSFPNVPTIGAFMKAHPPLEAGGVAAMTADASALDGGTGFFGPPGIPANVTKALTDAIASTFKEAAFKAQATKSSLDTAYLSPAGDLADINTGLKSSTVALMRKYVPMSQGEAS